MIIKIKNINHQRALITPYCKEMIFGLETISTPTALRQEMSIPMYLKRVVTKLPVDSLCQLVVVA